MKPTAIIYQNETNVVIIFSGVADDGEHNIRGALVSFKNHWMDGGASGIAGFQNKKEMNKFIKENHLVKKGTVKLNIYCWSTFTKKDGATLTCELNPNHKEKHKSGKIKWSNK